MASCCNFSLKSELYCVFFFRFFYRLLPPFKWNSPHSDPTSPSPGVSRICRQWIAATIRSRSGDALYVLLTVSESMQSKRSISQTKISYGGFLKQGYPQVIHFRWGFSIINGPFLGTPIHGNPHILHCKHRFAKAVFCFSQAQVFYNAPRNGLLLVPVRSLRCPFAQACGAFQNTTGWWFHTVVSKGPIGNPQTSERYYLPKINIYIYIITITYPNHSKSVCWPC